MSDEDQCVKCDGYSGGSTLCIVCEKAAIKKDAKKFRKKTAGPLVSEMIRVLEEVEVILEEYHSRDGVYQMVVSVLKKSREEFK